MRLVVTIPASWPPAGVRLVIEPVGDLPDDLGAAGEAALARDLPDGARLEVVESRDGTGARGWPIRLVQGRVFGADGVQRETRLVALYRLHDWLGVVRLTASDRAAYEAHREALLELLTSADADLADGRPVGLLDALGGQSIQ